MAKTLRKRNWHRPPCESIWQTRRPLSHRLTGIGITILHPGKPSGWLHPGRQQGQAKESACFKHLEPAGKGICQKGRDHRGAADHKPPGQPIDQGLYLPADEMACRTSPRKAGQGVPAFYPPPVRQKLAGEERRRAQPPAG